MGLREYPQAGLVEMPTAPGLGPPARELFPRRLLAALYGQPGELGELTRRWPNEPGTYLQLVIGYLAGYPLGFKDTNDALWASLALVNAAVLSYVPPFQPGGSVADSPLVKYLDEAGQLEALRELGQTLTKLEREGIIDAVTDGAELLAEAIGEAMIRWAASYGEKLRSAKTPFEFARWLGRLAGRLIGDAIVAALINRAFLGIAEEVGAATVRGAASGVARLEAEVAEEVATNRAAARGWAKLEAKLEARRRAVARGWAKLEARRGAAAGEIVPAGGRAMRRPAEEIVEAGGDVSKPAATRGLPGAGDQPPPKALPTGTQPAQLGAGQIPKALPGGERPALPGPQLLLGDLEQGGAGPAAAATQASVFVVAAPVTAAQQALIAANLRNVPGLPGWAYNLPDDITSELVLRARPYHPYTAPEVAGKLDRAGKPISITQQREAKVSVLSGGAQETLLPLDPAYKAVNDAIVDVVRQDGRWELASLRFTNRVYYLRPAEGGAPTVQRAQITDGLWIARSKDPGAIAQFVVPGIVESKSASNVTDLFYETLHGKRLPTEGQVYRDMERLPNLTLILEFSAAGDRVERWVIPPGQVGVSRRTTQFVLVWPPGPDRSDAISLLVGEGFSRRNITTLPPTFPRPQIEQLYRRLLDTPLDRLLPAALLPPKAKP